MERHDRPIVRVENGVNAHKCFLPALGASHRAARVCPSRFQTPLCPDATTFRDRSPSCSQQLLPPRAISFPQDGKSCHKPRAYVSTKIVFHPAVTNRQASGRAKWRSPPSPLLFSDNLL